jgi:hypothetical protein
MNSGEDDAVKSKAHREIYLAMQNEIETALMKAKKDFAKPFLSIGHHKTWNEYVAKVTTSKSSYQYPKMLGLALFKAYQKYPPADPNRDDDVYKAVCKIAAANVAPESVKASRSKSRK